MMRRITLKLRWMMGFSMICFLLLGYKSISVASTINDLTLGRATGYSVLAGSALTKGDSSSISGDLPSEAGIYPTLVATDLANLFVATGASDFQNGTTSAADAQTDLAAAISSISTLVPTVVSALFSNQTLGPGVYAAPPSSALAITVGLVLDAGGDPNARFIFRTDAALNIDAGLTVQLAGGAQERNVFWMVGTAVTVGTGSDVPGNFLVVSVATLEATTIIRGSLLCESAVTLGANSQIIYDHLTTVGGALSISAPGSISLGSTASPSSVSIAIGAVVVNDLRGVAPGGGWVASAIASNLTSTSGGLIPANDIGYSAGTISTTGTILISSGDQTDLSSQETIVSASAISGNNTASWTPTITVIIPFGVANGDYTATITQSVA